MQQGLERQNRRAVAEQTASAFNAKKEWPQAKGKTK